MAAAKLHRRTGRRRAGRFLAEGPNLVVAALQRGDVVEVFATAEAAHRHADALAGAPVAVVTERAAAALSDTVTPAGLVAVCRIPAVTVTDVVAASPRLAVAAVDLAEPGNAGTLIRTADAMGAGAVLMAGSSVDAYNGKCLRASAGSIFGPPVVEAPDPGTAADALRTAGLQVLATTVDGEITLDEAAALLGRPTLWLFGPEARGLPAALAADADHRVRIPVAGAAESLNVAAAAAICLYASASAHRRGL